MDADGSGMFSSPERFEAYLEGVTHRLSSLRNSRADFLRGGIERLAGLQEMARAVNDQELERELSEHLEQARASLNDLESLVVPPV